MEFNHDNIKKIRGLILFTVLIIVCLWQYDVVLSAGKFIFKVVAPFVVGGAIAFVLNVPMNFFERHLFPEKRREKYKIVRKTARPVSLILVLICVFGIFGLIMFVLIPQLGHTFANLGESIQVFMPKVRDWAEELFRNNREVMKLFDNLKFDWNSIAQWGVNFFTNGAESMLDTTIIAAKSIVSGIATFFIAFVFACYILLQKEKLNIQVKKVLFAFVPKGRAEAALEVCTLTYNTFSGFLTGQCVEAIILGSMFVIAMTVFQLPYALLIGILIAFTALIPIFGAFIGCIIGAFLIFMVDPFKALIFIILFLVLQQLEGNLIYPHVVGGSVGLPSIWVLAAVTIGGSLMGVVGMLIFIPLVSVVYALFREVVYLKLKKNNIDPKDIA